MPRASRLFRALASAGWCWGWGLTNRRACCRSGEVILAELVKTLVEPNMRCPLTGKKLKKSDLIYLAAGGTSFSAHNKVTASKYTPTM